MNILIIKPCALKRDGTTQNIKAGILLCLNDNKAQQIIDAGYAEAVNVIEEASAMISEFSIQDPGGDCWHWIRNSEHELWQHHLKALRESDLETARRTFNEMKARWEHQEEHKQPDISAHGGNQ